MNIHPSKCWLKYLGRTLSPLLCIILYLASGRVASAADDDLNALAGALVENEPGTPEHNAALAAAQNLSPADAGKVATEMTRRATTAAQDQVKTLLNLYKLGLKAGKGPLKTLGKELAKAVDTAIGNLMNILRDPKTNGGQQQLLHELQKFGLSLNDAMDVVDNLAAQALALELSQTKKGAMLKSQADHSLHFDATTGMLSLTDDLITSVLRANGLLDTSDPIVGSEVKIPNFMLSGFSPEGFATFKNVGDDPLLIQKGSSVFLEAYVPNLVFDGTRFEALLSDLVLSGAPTTSLYSGGLPNLGSLFISETDDALMNGALSRYFFLEIFPDADFKALTSNFTASGATTFANYMATSVPVPEPATGWFVFGSAGLWLVATARRTKKRLRAGVNT